MSEPVTVSGDGYLVRAGDLVWYGGDHLSVEAVERYGSGPASLLLTLPSGSSGLVEPRHVAVDARFPRGVM